MWHCGWSQGWSMVSLTCQFRANRRRWQQQSAQRVRQLIFFNLFLFQLSLLQYNFCVSVFGASMLWVLQQEGKKVARKKTIPNFRFCLWNLSWMTRENVALHENWKAGTWFAYPGGIEGWVDLDDLICLPRPALFLHSIFRLTSSFHTWWLGGVVGRALDSRWADREFNSRLLHCQATTLGKLFTPVCLCSPSSIIWYLARAFMLTHLYVAAI